MPAVMSLQQRQRVAHGLRASLFAVDRAGHGREGERCLSAYVYDLPTLISCCCCS